MTGPFDDVRKKCFDEGRPACACNEYARGRAEGAQEAITAPNIARLVQDAFEVGYQAGVREMTYKNLYKEKEAKK